MYQITIAEKQVKRLADNAFIPFDEENIDYRDYLAWRASPCDRCEGRGAIPDMASKGVIQCPACKGMQRNTPLPADPPPAPDPKIKGVEFDGVMCGATRDDQNGLVAVLVAHALQKENFQPTDFYFANGNKLTLTAQNIEAFTAVWMPFRQLFFKPKPV